MSVLRKTPRRWTTEEDSLLYREAIKQSPGSVWDWNRIAANFTDRSNKDCRKRWVNRVSGGLKKGPWGEDEDTKLREAIERLGQRWTLVAEAVGCRSADQCAKRWQHHLDPQLDRRVWTPLEDEQVLRAVEQSGRTWKEIRDQYFPARSRNDVKNRYTILLRRGRGSSSAKNNPAPAGDSELNSDDDDDDDDVSDAERDDAPGPNQDTMELDHFLAPFSPFDLTVAATLGSPPVSKDPSSYMLCDSALSPRTNDVLLQQNMSPFAPSGPLSDNMDQQTSSHSVAPLDTRLGGFCVFGPSDTLDPLDPLDPSDPFATLTLPADNQLWSYPTGPNTTPESDSLLSMLPQPPPPSPLLPTYRRVTLVLEDYEKGLMDQLLQIVSTSQGKSRIEILP